MKRYPDLTREERIEKVMGERRADVALVLENLAEELNIAAILRTCEGFGIAQIYVVYKGKKPRVKLGSASGASKWLKIKYYKSTKGVLEAVKKQKFKIYGALVDPNAKSLWQQKFSGKVALVVGNEAQGLSESVQKLVDQSLYIPMLGLTESFNVSVATGIFLAEILRQKSL